VGLEIQITSASTVLNSLLQRLLEVGALKHDNYSRHSSWINCTPIDLRSRHPSIREQDFLLLNVDENKEKWDVISLSLVLNFVPDARDRGNFESPFTSWRHILTILWKGRMLRLAHQFLRAASSFLFLVLPLPCIMNSRYIDLPNLHALLSCLGFKVVKERWKPGGKVAYWLLEKSIPEGKTEIWEKKRVVREGKTRNNFCILL
jgi:25S rRNA (adenine2142-N1)-methyltransferase